MVSRQQADFVSAGHYRRGEFDIIHLVSSGNSSTRNARWEIRHQGRPTGIRRHVLRDARLWVDEEGERWLTKNLAS